MNHRKKHNHKFPIPEKIDYIERCTGNINFFIMIIPLFLHTKTSFSNKIALLHTQKMTIPHFRGICTY